VEEGIGEITRIGWSEPSQWCWWDYV